jgi:hypothetical protein
MADREFLRNVLGLSSVDAGHGWLIFALGLDGRLASHKSPDIQAKENIRYELAQPQ